jgi:hypothetical protein
VRLGWEAGACHALRHLASARRTLDERNFLRERRAHGCDLCFVERGAVAECRDWEGLVQADRTQRGQVGRKVGGAGVLCVEERPEIETLFSGQRGQVGWRLRHGEGVVLSGCRGRSWLRVRAGLAIVCVWRFGWSGRGAVG